MKKIVSYSSVLILMVIGFQSCQTEENVPDQSKIFAVYALDYNASLDKTSAEACFYVNKPSQTNQQKIELVHPGKVTYNSGALVFNTVNRSYTKEFVGLIEAHFIYTNYYESSYANHIEMVEPIEVQVSSDSADMQLDYHFNVSGTSLESEEVIDVHVESITSGQVFSSTFTEVFGISIQVTADQLSVLGVGPIVIRTSRRSLNDDNVQGPPVGGEVHVQYSVQDTVYVY